MAVSPVVWRFWRRARDKRLYVHGAGYRKQWIGYFFNAMIVGETSGIGKFKWLRGGKSVFIRLKELDSVERCRSAAVEN